MATVAPLVLLALQPSFWRLFGFDVDGVVPINTSIRQISLQSLRGGIHVLKLFGGIGLGVLRVASGASPRATTAAKLCHTLVIGEQPFLG